MNHNSTPQTNSKTSKLRNAHRKYRPLVFVLIFGAIGAALYIFTRAATPTSSFEVEASTLSGNASSVADVAASGGQAIRFNKPVVTPEPVLGATVWISSEEIAALPTSGAAWDNMKSAATGSLGSVNLADNNSTHDTNVLALAYYSTRMNSAVDKKRVAQEISTVPGSGTARALEFSRNITSYIIAADVIKLKSVDPAVDTSFRAYVNKWVLTDTTLAGHSGGDGIKGCAEKSGNNWGGMCRAAYAAAARYLGNASALDSVTKWHKGFLGDRVAYADLNYTDTDWHADGSAKRGINAKGAKINGNNVDGLIPEDQRRTGSYTWPAPKGHYPWEAMQGALVTDVILQRASKVTPSYQDSAMARAYSWLYNVNGNPAASDDTWQMWVANKVYGTSYPTQTGVPPGKLMAWTDWTHAK